MSLKCIKNVLGGVLNKKSYCKCSGKKSMLWIQIEFGSGSRILALFDPDPGLTYQLKKILYKVREKLFSNFFFNFEKIMAPEELFSQLSI